MEKLLTLEELIQLITTGVVELSDDLMIRLDLNAKPHTYQDEDWYNDPNCVMSRHHY